MNALILGGGFSTRLYPMTEYFPKGLLEVGGKAVTGQIVDDIIACGIKEIAIVTNNRCFKAFEAWIQKNYTEQQIHVINDGIDNPDDRLGAIGDLVFALDELGWEEDVLVVASDTLVSLEVKKYIEFYEKHHGVTIAVIQAKSRDQIANRLGCIEVDGDKMIGCEEKPTHPKSDYMAIPYYIFPKESISLIRQYQKEGNATDAPGYIFPWLIGKIATYAYKIEDGYYFDVGTKETLEFVRTKFNK